MVAGGAIKGNEKEICACWLYNQAIASVKLIRVGILVHWGCRGSLSVCAYEREREEEKEIIRKKEQDLTPTQIVTTGVVHCKGNAQTSGIVRRFLSEVLCLHRKDSEQQQATQNDSPFLKPVSRRTNSK